MIVCFSSKTVACDPATIMGSTALFLSTGAVLISYYALEAVEKVKKEILSIASVRQIVRREIINQGEHHSIEGGGPPSYHSSSRLAAHNASREVVLEQPIDQPFVRLAWAPEQAQSDDIPIPPGLMPIQHS